MNLYKGTAGALGGREATVPSNSLQLLRFRICGFRFGAAGFTSSLAMAALNHQPITLPSNAVSQRWPDS